MACQIYISKSHSKCREDIFSLFQTSAEISERGSKDQEFTKREREKKINLCFLLPVVMTHKTVAKLHDINRFLDLNHKIFLFLLAH
jgi:hypothetical protein